MARQQAASSHESVGIEPHPQSPLPARCELALAVAIGIIGLSARLMFPERMSIDHFDEGVYASNIWFDAVHGFRFPQRDFYAPPLLPALIELSLIAFSDGRLSAMWPCLVAGSATPLLLWWFVRRWFDPGVGLAAASLCSLADVHVLYSRTALTDALLVFWLVLAVGLLVEALATKRILLAAAGGLVTGLAWWTKYNGWLPLAISAAGIAVGAAFDSRVRQGFRGLVGIWLVAAVTAVAVWSPVIISLNDVGGYSAVSANHRQYVVGLQGWFASASRQVANLHHVENGLSLFGTLLAVSSAFIVSRKSFATFGVGPHIAVEKALIGFVAAWLLALSAWLGSTVTMAFAALCALIQHGRSIMGSSDESRPVSNRLAFWILVSWFVGLLFATPLYRPYSRLVLPWLVSIWMGGGLGIGYIVKRLGGLTWPKSVVQQWVAMALAAIAVLVVLGCSLWTWRSRDVIAWQDRTGLERIAHDMKKRINSSITSHARTSRPAAVWVYGEPSLFYHLRSAGLPLVQPTVDLRDALQLTRKLELTPFIVVGPHAQRSLSFQVEWPTIVRQATKLSEYPYDVSDLVQLDHYSPNEIASKRTHQDVVQLFVMEE